MYTQKRRKIVGASRRSVICLKLMRSLEDLYSPNIQAWLNLNMQIKIKAI